MLPLGFSNLKTSPILKLEKLGYPYSKGIPFGANSFISSLLYSFVWSLIKKVECPDWPLHSPFLGTLSVLRSTTDESILEIKIWIFLFSSLSSVLNKIRLFKILFFIF